MASISMASVDVASEMKVAHVRRPLDLGEARVPHGEVYVIPERCKGCGYCIEFCPEKVLSESEETNAKGYRYPIVPEDRAEKCVNCGFCNLVCPEMAIFARDVAEQPASAVA